MGLGETEDWNGPEDEDVEKAVKAILEAYPEESWELDNAVLKEIGFCEENFDLFEIGSADPYYDFVKVECPHDLKRSSYRDAYKFLTPSRDHGQTFDLFRYGVMSFGTGDISGDIGSLDADTFYAGFGKHRTVAGSIGRAVCVAFLIACKLSDLESGEEQEG